MKNYIFFGLLSLSLAGAMALGGQDKSAPAGLKMQSWGKTPDGKVAHLYTLTNGKGIEAAITDFGATLVSLKVPDRGGKLADVVLGYDSLEGYITDKAYFGATVGRYANRIAHGKFTLNGVTYTLAKNNGENSLHGGIRGFNKALWSARDVSTKDYPALELRYLSKDGEEGYPGNLSVQVVYSFTPRNELKIEYSATTDQDTVINLTNHSYFNLGGEGSGNILNHVLELKADRFTPINADLIPTGELRDVSGTPFDFRKATAIGARIGQDDQQLKLARGYDHNFVLNHQKPGDLTLAAMVYEPEGSRLLEVLTTEPGIQFYSGNFLDGTIRGKGGHIYNQRDGLCLETQHFPDSPNHPEFPTTVLKAGARFHSETVLRFGIWLMH